MLQPTPHPTPDALPQETAPSPPILPPQAVWAHLTPQQQQTVTHTLIRLCQHLLTDPKGTGVCDEPGT